MRLCPCTYCLAIVSLIGHRTVRISPSIRERHSISRRTKRVSEVTSIGGSMPRIEAVVVVFRTPRPCASVYACGPICIVVFLLLFRLNPSEDSRRNMAQSNPRILGQPNESKFGMTQPQLLSCLVQARAWGVRRFGLHAMILSNCLSTDEVVETARLLFSVAVEVKKTLGLDIELINLGGGTRHTLPPR